MPNINNKPANTGKTPYRIKKVRLAADRNGAVAQPGMKENAATNAKDFHITPQEKLLIRSYRRANPEDRKTVDSILGRYSLPPIGDSKIEEYKASQKEASGTERNELSPNEKIFIYIARFVVFLVIVILLFMLWKHFL